MGFPDVEQPPLKKRRFFAEETPSAEHNVYFDPQSPQDANVNMENFVAGPSVLPCSTATRFQNDVSQASNTNPLGFDKEVFESFVGDKVSCEVITRLQEVSDGIMERAINMYLDGSWRDDSRLASHSNSEASSHGSSMTKRDIHRPESIKRTTSHSLPSPSKTVAMPECRYVGALGVAAWATRSGTSLVSHGESVKIERTRIKPTVKTGRGRSAVRMRTDVVVRFTNKKGEEIGRLPQDTASWVSTLMDQKVCRFDGACVFIPERVRVNDTIYLQLRCSLLKSTFEGGNFVKPEDNNRTTGIFEEKESSAEKDLRLRQVALVKLFDEINLHPSKLNEKTAKHKRERILQAAEIAEQNDAENDSKRPKPSQEPGSSPPANDEAEEGKELEQDQLDSLYKKAQSFDFETPIREPANTFSMDLRKYQKQALYWMMNKEKDEKSENKEVSMHPLWEEYKWPLKDMDDRDVPGVVNQNSFYVNPYSGELSLDFPFQEQNCLGGILADGRESSRVIQRVCANISRNGSRQDN